MIKLWNKEIKANHFPDGSLLIKEDLWTDYVGSCSFDETPAGLIAPFPVITWHFENNEELVTLIYLVKHLRANGFDSIELRMPYIPNARQDRVKNDEDVFTLKYFAEIINWLHFNSIQVLDPHSYVSEALLDRIIIKTPKNLVDRVLETLSKNDDTKTMLFFPDEGAMKRYSSMFDLPYAFGIKKRDWETGTINGLDVSGMTDNIAGSRILIVDDICSRGGTFYHSAKKLKELGAKDIYLFVSHCENTILEGELLTSGLISRVFTTNSIFTKEHEMIEVFDFDEY